jgi:hypothetical protein
MLDSDENEGDLVGNIVDTHHLSDDVNPEYDEQQSESDNKPDVIFDHLTVLCFGVVQPHFQDVNPPRIDELAQITDMLEIGCITFSQIVLYEQSKHIA